MVSIRQRTSLILVAVIAAALIILIFPAAASNTDVGAEDAADGFRALTGEEAADFEMPEDMELSATEELQKSASGAELTAERYLQFHGEAEVLGGQLTVYKANDVAVAVIGGHYNAIEPQNEINLSPDEAQKVAVRQIGRGGEWFTTLMIDPVSGLYYYRIENQRFDSRWFHWIDAENGSIINAYDGLAHGDGLGVDGETKDLTDLTTLDGGEYLLISADGRQKTYDARNRSRLPGVLVADDDDSWDTPGRTSPAHPAMVDAQFFARVTDQYYLATHGFNWTDHFPQGMVSSAHYKRKHNNAYWNGNQMIYGDGDGVNFVELSGDLDVVGHELTHGVTDATSYLIYQNESGALNEAFSDIMGTAVEFSFGSGNWTIGEDITPGTNGIRNMKEPGEDGDPSHYAERYTGTGDNGGVHTNSGIANQWFQILVDGGQNSDSAYASGTNVKGIGMALAEDVAFLGFTALPATADFCEARASTIAVAGDDAGNVSNAWDEVGVDDALCNGSGGGSGTGSGPDITDVASTNQKGTKFRISWTTDVPATSVVEFTCCGNYSDSELVTNHSMGFRGSVGFNYEYYVTSVDSSGYSTTEGPFFHQN